MSAARYRVVQVRAVAAGVAGFLTALVGGVVQSQVVAVVGIAIFLIALGVILVVGFLAWRKHG